jgi:hypothetical protein
MASLSEKAAEAHSKLAKSAVVSAPSSAPKAAPKPAPKEVKVEKPKEKPKEERKKISLTTGDTAMGVHDKLQQKRYGSYGHALKVYLSAPVAGYLFISGDFLFAIPFIFIAGYFAARYREDHGKYLSWKKRPVIVPDMGIFDKNPKVLWGEGLHGFLNPPAPPTIVD